MSLHITHVDRVFRNQNVVTYAVDVGINDIFGAAKSYHQWGLIQWSLVHDSNITELIRQLLGDLQTDFSFYALLVVFCCCINFNTSIGQVDQKQLRVN